ncbi:MAG: hypothetical protein KatS3mg110_1119 [Pirellulaceae bacterium]|nr:MAG: hypothetical protein KatS3mg110_1119 [Pirellulaceae bacterium]
MKALLIHDTRSVGFLTGAVLARVLSRSGIEVAPFFDVEKTRNVVDFWSQTAPALALKEYASVILCCMTFDSKNPDLCISQLRRFEEETGDRPLILSHRWPDGYEHTGMEVVVPPFDVMDRWGSDLQPAERELLRFSLIISRQADPGLVRDDEVVVADRLGALLGAEPEKYWRDLVTDPAAVIEQIRSMPQVPAAELLREKGRCEIANEKCALFRLEPEVRGHGEKTVEALLETVPASIGIGVRTELEDEEDVHIYLVRAWRKLSPKYVISHLPSIEYLIERYGRQFNLPGPEHWIGPQDAKTLRFKYEGLKSSHLPYLADSLVRFATFAADVYVGERRPVAGLAKTIHSAATEALWELDLAKRYTKGEPASLRFDPLKLRVLVDKSNRTGELRSTLVMRLIVSSPDAAAFLLKHQGYNLMKLERVLEGILLGLRLHRSSWLGLHDIPKRLRIDLQFQGFPINRLTDSFASAPEVSTMPLDEALRLGILREKSSIGVALFHYCPKEKRQLVLFRGSETIGPSVPYAVTVGSIAAALGMLTGKQVQILDLFSGAGLAAHAVLTKQQTWCVCCVDATTTAEEAGIESIPNVVWLNADVKDILAPERRLLKRVFDVVAADPPHSAMFELLFERRYGDGTFLDRVKDLGPWLVVYQGHVSQEGRAVALHDALKDRYENVVRWAIGPEVVTIAGPAEWNGHSFTEVVGRAKDLANRDCEKLGLLLEEYGRAP